MIVGFGAVYLDFSFAAPVIAIEKQAMTSSKWSFSTRAQKD